MHTSVRICALDFGEARIGVAVSDEYGITVNTRPVIENNKDVFRKLLERFSADRIGLIIVGVPHRHDGSQSHIVQKIEEFIVELRKHTPLKVIEVDESFSTKRAFHTMKLASVSKKRRITKGTKDAFAAALILQDYLEEKRT